MFVRSLLEQSRTVWHSMLTSENEHDLERVQKSAVRIISKNNYRNYEKECNRLNLISLKDRREMLCLSLAKKSINNPKMAHLFVKNDKKHEMKTRYPESYIVNHANTSRLQNSPIIYMQRILNEYLRKQ